MKRLKQLEQMKDDVLSKMNAITETVEAYERVRTDEETIEFDGLSTQLENIKKEHEQLLAQNRAERSLSTSTDDFPDGTVVTVGEPQILTDPQQGFKSFGEFGASVFRAMSPSNASLDERLKLVAAVSGMSQGLPSDGGFLVPPAYSNTIWLGLQTDSSSLLSLTDNYVVTGESLTFNSINETSRADGSRWGGVRGYWRAEAAQFTKSKPTFREIKLEPQELYVFVYVTDKLLRNSNIALDQFLTRAAIDEIGFKVGDAIINGTGAGQPLGILASNAPVSIAKESSQEATSIVPQNLSKMWARMHTRSKANAIWLMNTDVNPELDNMFISVTNIAGSENVGGFNTRIYNPDTNAIKGKPVIESEFAATLGTVGDVILADLKAYVTGTKGSEFAGVRTDMSIHLRFDFGETAFRFTFEVDGQPWINSAITPFKGTATVSPFVTVATRA